MGCEEVLLDIAELDGEPHAPALGISAGKFMARFVGDLDVEFAPVLNDLHRRGVLEHIQRSVEARLRVLVVCLEHFGKRVEQEVLHPEIATVEIVRGHVGSYEERILEPACFGFDVGHVAVLAGVHDARRVIAAEYAVRVHADRRVVAERPLAIRPLEGEHVVFVERFVLRPQCVQHIRTVRLAIEHGVAHVVAGCAHFGFAVPWRDDDWHTVEVLRYVVQWASACVVGIDDVSRAARLKRQETRGFERVEYGLILDRTDALLEDRINRAVTEVAVDPIEILRQEARAVRRFGASREPAARYMTPQTQVAGKGRVLFGDRHACVKKRIAGGVAHHGDFPAPEDRYLAQRRRAVTEFA